MLQGQSTGTLSYEDCCSGAISTFGSDFMLISSDQTSLTPVCESDGPGRLKEKVTGTKSNLSKERVGLTKSGDISSTWRKFKNSHKNSYYVKNVDLIEWKSTKNTYFSNAQATTKTRFGVKR